MTLKEVVLVGNDGMYVGVDIVDDSYNQTVVTNVDENDNPISHVICCPVPEGLYLPKWDFDNAKWIEGKSQEEIDAIKNAPAPVSEVDNLKTQLSDLTLMVADLITGGV